MNNQDIKLNLKPDISFIIPFYNVGDYLRECLDSILINKNYNNPNNMIYNQEIILINDGSTDNSVQIALEYANTYPNIILIHYHDNKGQSYARNQGLKMARGEYIYCVDSDDFLLINQQDFANILTFAKNYHHDLIRFRACYIYPELPNQYAVMPSHIQDFNPDLIYSLTGEQCLISMVSKNMWIPSICWTLIKRDLLQKHNLLFLEGVKAEDQLFYIQILTCQPNIQILEYPQVAYAYRLHGQSTVGTPSQQYILDHFRIIQEIQFWQENHDFSDELNANLREIQAILHQTANQLLLKLN